MIKKSALIATAAFVLTSIIPTTSMANDIDAAKKAIDDALPGKLMHNPVTIEWENRGNDKKIKVVDAATPSGQAISAKIKRRKTNPWDTALWFDLEDGVNKGDMVEVHFWARTEKAARSKDTAEFVVFLGRNEEPYDYIISEDFAPGSEWKLHTLKGKADARYPSGEIKMEFQLAKHAQTVEFGPVYVSNLGPVTE